MCKVKENIDTHPFLKCLDCAQQSADEADLLHETHPA